MTLLNEFLVELFQLIVPRDEEYIVEIIYIKIGIITSNGFDEMKIGIVLSKTPHGTKQAYHDAQQHCP